MQYFHNIWRIAFLGFIIVFGALLVPNRAFAAATGAANLVDIQALIDQGKLSDALYGIERYAEAHPVDVQGRFTKGVIFVGMDRTAEAIDVFTRLTEDHPSLPEPYINLAALYATQRDYKRVEAMLIAALRTHPSYALAYENLVDLYAYLSETEAQNSSIGPVDANAKKKMPLIKSIGETSARKAIAVQPELIKEEQKIVRVADTEEQSQPKVKVEVKAEAVKVEPVEVESVVKAESVKTDSVTVESVVKAEPIKLAALNPNAVKSDVPKSNTVDLNHTDLMQVINNWAIAWSKKDVPAYFNFYAKNFKTPVGQTREQWESERSTRIRKPSSITLRLKDVQISMNGTDAAEARFLQHYSTSSFKDSSNKMLLLVKQDGQWKIAQERVVK